MFMAFLFNRATADDYSYGEYTRRAWVETGSVLEVFKAAFQKVHDIYFSWQGTWFDVFLFSMQPEVFSNSAYWIGNLLTMVLFISAFFWIMHRFMVKRLGIEKNIFFFSTVAFLFLFYQFVPDKYSSIFWYNGCAHYMIPTAIVFWGISLAVDYSIDYKNKSLIVVSFIYAILGGVNYLPAIMSLLLLVYIIVDSYYFRKVSSSKIFLLSIPMGLEMIGLLISVLAPGNYIREDIPFSLKLFVSALFLSFKNAFIDMINRFRDYSYLLLFLLVFAIVFFLLLLKSEHINSDAFAKPALFTAVMYIVYTLMYWPEMFVQTTVSPGVSNFCFMAFYLMLFVSIIYWEGWIICYLRKKNKSKEGSFLKYRGTIIISVAVIFVGISLLYFKDYLKESTDYRCYRFLTSGSASVYKEKMDRQTEILEDTSNLSPMLPIIGDNVDPLFCMSISKGKDAWANRALCRFYGKDEVYGVSEEEWKELYYENE